MWAPFFVHYTAELMLFCSKDLGQTNSVVQLEGCLDDCALILRDWKARNQGR